MRRGLAGCLTAVGVLSLTGGAALFWIRDDDAAARQHAQVAAMPAGWMDLIRRRATVPADVADLALPDDIDGDAAAAVRDTAAGVWRIFRVDSTYARVTAGAPRPQDRFTLEELAADTVLDRWVRWARHRQWNGVARLLAAQDPSSDLLALRLPDYHFVQDAVTALVLRGWHRADHGEARGARSDFAAAIGLGVHLARHEPTVPGFLMGRAAVFAGATGLLHLAATTHDTALGARAHRAAEWAAPSSASDYGILAAAPESALALAADPALAAGWRAEALIAAIRGPLARPSVRVFGLPRRIVDGIRALAEDGGQAGGRAGGHDPSFQVLTDLALLTAQRVNDAGPLERMRRFGQDPRPR